MNRRGSGYIGTKPGIMQPQQQQQYQQPPQQQQYQQPQQPQYQQQMYDDVQTGVLMNEQIDWQFDQYQGQNPPDQPQSQYQEGQFAYDIYGVGPVQNAERWDLMMAFIGIGNDCFRVLIGISDVNDSSFVSLEKWYQDIPQGMNSQDIGLLESVVNIISTMYNNIMLLGTDKMRTEWLTPLQQG